MTHNPNCDGNACRRPEGEVRVLPTGGDGNSILCHWCFDSEIAWRRDRNRFLCEDVQFDLPSWDKLEIYGGE